jgi:hypothetical protein
LTVATGFNDKYSYDRKPGKPGGGPVLASIWSRRIQVNILSAQKSIYSLSIAPTIIFTSYGGRRGSARTIVENDIDRHIPKGRGQSPRHLRPPQPVLFLPLRSDTSICRPQLNIALGNAAATFAKTSPTSASRSSSRTNRRASASLPTCDIWKATAMTSASATEFIAEEDGKSHLHPRSPAYLAHCDHK